VLAEKRLENVGLEALAIGRAVALRVRAVAFCALSGWFTQPQPTSAGKRDTTTNVTQDQIQPTGVLLVVSSCGVRMRTLFSHT